MFEQLVERLADLAVESIDVEPFSMLLAGVGIAVVASFFLARIVSAVVQVLLFPRLVVASFLIVLFETVVAEQDVLAQPELFD